jgi:hypothetical protein
MSRAPCGGRQGGRVGVGKCTTQTFGRKPLAATRQRSEASSHGFADTSQSFWFFPDLTSNVSCD